MRPVSKAIDWLETACVLCSVASVAAILSLTVTDIALRKLTRYGIPGLYEFTQDYLMVALVFLAISHVYRRGGHVRVVLFQKFIPVFLLKPLQKSIELLVSLFLAIVALAGFQAAMSAWQLKEVSSNILSYPLAPALFMVPLGCALTVIRIVQSWCKS